MLLVEKIVNVRVADDRGRPVHLAWVEAPRIVRRFNSPVLPSDIHQFARRTLFGMDTALFWLCLGMGVVGVLVPIFAVGVVVKVFGYPPPLAIVLSVPIVAGCAVFLSGLRLMRRKYARRLIAIVTAHEVCPSCGCELAGVDIEEDDCTICPRCSAAWKLRGANRALDRWGDDPPVLPERAWRRPGSTRTAGVRD